MPVALSCIGIFPRFLVSSSSKITQDIYSHVLPEMQKEAAAAIDRVFAKAAEDGQKKAVRAKNVIDFAERAAAKRKSGPGA